MPRSSPSGSCIQAWVGCGRGRPRGRRSRRRGPRPSARSAGGDRGGCGERDVQPGPRPARLSSISASSAASWRAASACPCPGPGQDAVHAALGLVGAAGPGEQRRPRARRRPRSRPGRRESGDPGAQRAAVIERGLGARKRPQCGAALVTADREPSPSSPRRRAPGPAAGRATASGSTGRRPGSTNVVKRTPTPALLDGGGHGGAPRQGDRRHDAAQTCRRPGCREAALIATSVPVPIATRVSGNERARR